MADSTNIIIRSAVARPLTYEEVDGNFGEVATLIDEYNLFVSNQTSTNDSFQTQIDAKLGDAPSDTFQYVRKDGVWARLQTTDTTWGSITGLLSDQTDLNNRFVAVENDVDTLQNDMVVVNGRVDGLEQLVTDTSVNKTLENTEHCTTKVAGLTITLPLNPQPRWFVLIGVKDWTDTLVNRNGQNIMGLAQNMTIDKPNRTVTLMFVDATEGWRIV